MTDLDSFRHAVIGWVTSGGDEARALASSLSVSVESVILVEGVSDEAAIVALGGITGDEPELARACIIPMGGATNIAKYLTALTALGVRVAGLCDAGEERYFRRALARVGFGTIDSRARMAAAGFFVCVEDLEDELIRALGVELVQRVLQEHGDWGLFHTFQNQPAQRGRPVDRQLRRFLGTTAGRKERYAKLLVGALDPSKIPRPLGDLMRFAG
ncbi:TOPRIM nucleotidyl transferase/hydrolase domain-containing protein [Lacisediminihabitans sp. FW035]